MLYPPQIGICSMETPYYAAFCAIAPSFDSQRDAEIARSSGGYEASFLGPVTFDQLRPGEVFQDTLDSKEVSDLPRDGTAQFEAALHLALAQASAVDWARRLEQVLQLPSETALDILLRSIALHQLTGDFEAVCTVVASEIVAQLAKPVQHWRITPADSVGGVAGGQKFVVGNIFFKFARDSGIYGGDEGACKAAKHELRSLRKLLTTNTSGLSFPLMCTVDLAGFRLVCVSKLPISDATLVYGSSDAGRTVHARDPVMNKLMVSACSSLGLGPHNVGRARVDENNEVIHDSITMWGPIDIEGHTIVSTTSQAAAAEHHLDGTPSVAQSFTAAGSSYDEQQISRYVLDVARLFPPMALASVPGLTRFGLIAYPAGGAEPDFFLSTNGQRFRHNSAMRIIRDEDVSPKSTVEQAVQRFLLLQLPSLASNKLCNELGIATDSLQAAARDATTASWVPCQVVHTQLGALYAFDQAILRSIASAIQTDGEHSRVSEAEVNSNMTALGQNEFAFQLLGFPVQGPIVLAKDTGAVFFKLLRPEALAASPVALSSDAFTSFGCCTLCATGECHHGSRAEHLKVSALTNHLVEHTLRTMAFDIVHGSLLFPDGKSLVREMHARGLNLSLMGYLLKAISVTRAPLYHGLPQEWADTWVRQLLHIEMTARALRSILNERLRQSVRLQSAHKTASVGVACKTILQFIVEAFLLPPHEAGKKAPEAPALWKEVLFRGKLKFSTWALGTQWDNGDLSYGSKPAFLAYGVPLGILMTRFFDVSQIQETHPSVQALLELCIGLRNGEMDADAAFQLAKHTVEAGSGAQSPPYVARTKSMFGADLLEQSLVAYLHSLGDQAAAGPGAAVPPFVLQPQGGRLLCGVLHCFRCSDTVQQLCELVPHLCPRLSAWDMSASPAEETLLSTADAYEIYSIRLMQLTQEACRKRNLDMLCKWGPAVGKCINEDVPLTVQACSVLSVHGQCLEVLGQAPTAIQTIRRGLKFMQRFMPTHPILGQLSCNLARSLLSSDRADLRAIAALALDDAFRVFNKLYGSLTSSVAAKQDAADTARSITAVDVLISVLLMGMADKVGVHLGNLLQTLESLAGSAASAGRQRKIPKTLRQLQPLLEGYDGNNIFAACLYQAFEQSTVSETLPAAQPEEAAVPEAPERSGVLQLSRSDSTALAALDDIDVRQAAAFHNPSSTSLSEAQHKAVLRCIGRSTACMHMLEEFLGTPRDYFRGQTIKDAGFATVPLAEMQRPSDLLTAAEILSAAIAMRGESARTDIPVAYLLGEQRRVAGRVCSVCVFLPEDQPVAGEVLVTLKGAAGTIQAAVCDSMLGSMLYAQCIPYIAGRYSLHVSVDGRPISVQSAWDTPDQMKEAAEVHQAIVPRITIEPSMIDAGCCNFSVESTVYRSQSFFVRLTLRDTFGNRRQRESDAPSVRVGAPGAFSGSCSLEPCFGQDSIDSNAAEAGSGAGAVPQFSLRRGTADATVPAPPTDAGCDWICAVLPDTLVSRITCSWQYPAACYETHGEERVNVEVPPTNDGSTIWCNQEIPTHLLAGATPAKICISCAQTYGRKCLRCGKDSFFNSRRLHVCRSCAMRTGSRTACARCSSMLHFPASNVDAFECQTCARGSRLKCVARK
mgnify:CR=1 FL=1